MSHQVGSPRRRTPIWPGARRPNELYAGDPVSPPVAGWEPRYRRSVVVSDILSTLVAVSVVGGLVGAHTGMSGIKVALLGAVTMTVVLCSLAMNRVWNLVVLGQGAEEFGRLGRGVSSAD